MNSRYNNELFKIGLAFCFLLQSCVHVSSHETKAIDIHSRESHLQSVAVKNESDKKTANYHFMIYKRYLLPLEDFFSQLAKGELKSAFQKIDIRYKPANFENDAMEELLKSGFVPVYIYFQNLSDKEISIDESRFILKCDADSWNALNPNHLPKEFVKFSPKAVAANVYNASVVILGFAAMMGVLIVISENRSGDYDFFPLGSPSEPVFNSISKTSRIEYKDYLIRKKNLKTNQTLEGLLFFHPAEKSPTDNCRVEYAYTTGHSVVSGEFGAMGSTRRSTL